MSAGNKANEDPFYAVREDVNKQVERLKIRFEQFKDLLQRVDTSASVEFKELRKGITKDLRKADRDLTGLKGAVDQIEKNRAKFPHVKDQEFALRKKFVLDAQESINEIKQGFEAPAVRRKIDEDENKARRVNDGNNELAMNYNPNSSSLEADNTSFVKNQTARTHQAIAQQDKDLGILLEGVNRLDDQAKVINEEVKDQKKLLDRLDEDMDDAGNKMNFVQAQLSKLLKTKDGCQIWTIVILAVILIILVCLVIWV